MAIKLYIFKLVSIDKKFLAKKNDQIYFCFVGINKDIHRPCLP